MEEDLNIPYDALAGSVEPTTATLDCTGLVLYPDMGGRAAKRGASPGRSKAPGAASVTIRSVTGYYRRFSLEDADAYLLATRVGGEVLSNSHGYPLRLAAPGKRGFEWVKWIDRI